jgi:hypothetical protein
MVASTTACLAASRFGLAPSVKKVASAGLKLSDRPAGAVGLMSNDPAGGCGRQDQGCQSLRLHAWAGARLGAARQPGGRVRLPGSRGGACGCPARSRRGQGQRRRRQQQQQQQQGIICQRDRRGSGPRAAASGYAQLPQLLLLL